jgi:two-component system, OmpR family, phosphate regulon sensor histidine kinase PhoR
MHSKLSSMHTEIPFFSHYVPNILVVDDEPRIREACRMVLEESGYQVTLAADGTEGLHLIEAEHFDIILLDLMMPTTSGFDVLSKVKNLHPDTVVIIITGYATLDHSVEAMKKGAFDFIPKPFTPEHLRVVVAKAIEHTRTLHDIAETQSRMRVIINRLADGVMCVNAQERVVLANPAFLRLIGSRLDKAGGLGMDEVVVIPVLLDMVRESLEPSGEAEPEVAAELVLESRGAAAPGIVDARCLPLRDRRGRVIGAIAMLHDITALKHIDRLKSEFVQTVSHEIRGPMAAVMMQLKVVLDGLAGVVTDKQRDILSRAHAKIANQVQMAGELLDLARIESGLIVQDKEEVEMIQLMREQVELFEPRAAAAKIELTVGDVPEAVRLSANRCNMEEVLSNLIVNAIKYSPDGGRTTLAAQADGEYLVIRVADTGIGIAEEDLPYLFTRFYRVKNEKTRFIQGTGLGLVLVKNIVESHQGRIEVISRFGEGTTFTVFLPLMAD